MAALRFLKGVNVNSLIELAGENIVLGRNQECSIVLNVPAVSREHAMIRRINGQFFIEDLKSRNGTFVNNKEVTARTLLKDNDRIKICDNLIAFVEEGARPPLPAHMMRGATMDDDESEESSSTVEASISESSKNILETQPAEKLSVLLDITSELNQTLSVEELLPKIVDNLFQVFRQADRGFVILAEDKKLIPKVIKTRRNDDEAGARFSRRIVFRCLEMNEALLSEDASADKRFDLSQSIADCRIRSVMCAPLLGRTSQQSFGVLQLDTQDRFKKFTSEDLKLLIAVAGQAAIAIENARLHENLVARAGLERDLKLAHQVQLSFLPKNLPQVPGYDFYAHYESAQEVGGDFYDFIPLPDARLAISLGDVAGKGVPAALLMSRICSDTRYCMLTEPDLSSCVNKLNFLMQDASMLDRFVTLAVGLLTPATHEISFANAGHVPPIIYRKATGKLDEAMSRDAIGFPLGVLDGMKYQTVNLTLEPGDMILIISDGVTEAQDKDDKDFHIANVRAVMDQEPRTPKAIGLRLLNAVRQHSAGRKQHDDITIVCFGRT